MRFLFFFFSLSLSRPQLRKEGWTLSQMLELAISPSSSFISPFLLRGKTKGGGGGGGEREKRERPKIFCASSSAAYFHLSVERAKFLFLPFFSGMEMEEAWKGTPSPLCSSSLLRGGVGDKCVSKRKEIDDQNLSGFFCGKLP